MVYTPVVNGFKGSGFASQTMETKVYGATLVARFGCIVY